MMKAVVVFDSIYGNTRKVAETIAADLILAGHTATLISVRERQDVPDADIMFIGSPTRMGRMTGKTKRFVKHLNVEQWSGKRAFPFDTIMAMPTDPKEMIKVRRWVDNGAAPRLAEMLKVAGLKVEEPLRIRVQGTKGPLADDYKQRVKDHLVKLL